MKKIFSSFLALCMLIGCTGMAIAESDHSIPELEEQYEDVIQSYYESMGSPDDEYVKNCMSLKALNYKSYEYCTASYFAQTSIVSNKNSYIIKTFVHNNSVRWEQLSGDTLEYVQLYNATTDTYYEYDASVDSVRTITSASKKGRDMQRYCFGFFEWLGCNAPLGTRSETEFNGRKAELYASDFGNSTSSVWYDSEYGIPLQYTQDDWTETYTVVPGATFDEAIFTFDSAAPGAPYGIDDARASTTEKRETPTEQPVQSQDTEEEEAELDLKTLKRIPDFTCTDMNGNEINNDIFASSKLTLVNIWGTWCSPCVGEMPDLQKLYAKYKDDGFNVIGVVEDPVGNEDLIQAIVEREGVDYMILYPDNKFYDDFVSLCFAYPSSLLVDSEGNVVDAVIMGAPGFEALDELVESTMKNMEP